MDRVNQLIGQSTALITATPTAGDDEKYVSPQSPTISYHLYFISHFHPITS